MKNIIYCSLSVVIILALFGFGCKTTTDPEIEKVATPTFSPPGGTYGSTQLVTINCATIGATIRYTINGNDPNEASDIYNGPISINYSATFRATAYKSGWITSNIASVTYNIANQPETVANPVFSPPGGTYTTTQNVTISCATPGAIIKYTVDGSNPTSSSSTYSNPLLVSYTTTIKAKAMKDGWTDSQTVTAYYNIDNVSLCEVGSLIWSNPALCVEVSGSYAYLGVGSRLSIVNVSNATNPYEVSYCSVHETIVGIDIIGNYAYVITVDEGLRIIDISDKSSPYIVGSLDMSGSGYGMSITVVGNYAYIGYESEGLRIVNVSNKTNPYEVGQYDSPGFTYDVLVSGQIAYLADWSNCLRIVDISNPDSPHEVGYYLTQDESSSLFKYDNYLYVGGNYTLKVLDVGSPQNPVLAGSFSFSNGDTVDGLRSLYRYGPHLFIADSLAGLRILNVMNPGNITESCYTSTNQTACDVTYANNFIYLADGMGGLRIFQLQE